MPRPPAEHGTTNRWRTGCRCDPCTDAHNQDSKTYKRVLSAAAFGPVQRRRALALCRKGKSPRAAAEAVGITTQALWFFKGEPGWRAQLDAALMDGRRADVPHGTAAGYRHYKCFCPECRAAHHPARV